MTEELTQVLTMLFAVFGALMFLLMVFVAVSAVVEDMLFRLSAKISYYRRGKK